MPKQHKRIEADAKKPESVVTVEGQGLVSRLRRDMRSQGPAKKFHEKKADARRNLPSGPLGGSGRKTNVSRSS